MRVSVGVCASVCVAQATLLWRQLAPTASRRILKNKKKAEAKEIKKLVKFAERCVPVSTSLARRYPHAAVVAPSVSPAGTTRCARRGCRFCTR
jgi:hypothetical protein